MSVVFFYQGAHSRRLIDEGRGWGMGSGRAITSSEGHADPIHAHGLWVR